MALISVTVETRTALPYNLPFNSSKAKSQLYQCIGGTRHIRNIYALCYSVMVISHTHTLSLLIHNFEMG